MTSAQAQPPRLTRIGGWFKRKQFLIVYLVVVNLFILLTGFLITKYGHVQEIPFYAVVERFLAVFIPIRLVVEFGVFIFWRQTVALIRRAFKLGYKKTWFLLFCRRLFMLWLILDVVIHVVALAGNI